MHYHFQHSLCWGWGCHMPSRQEQEPEPAGETAASKGLSCAPRLRHSKKYKTSQCQTVDDSVSDFWLFEALTHTIFVFLVRHTFSSLLLLSLSTSLLTISHSGLEVCVCCWSFSPVHTT